ncbi:DnaJ C-terminal domain-containing protein [Pararhizobium haloflavum]|uniref:DnaJ C-terminal domain-containing protein n=1 Tax=Pararhizobium haloflavum TaxID=2037914 RepID=UPI0013000A0F|nr:DnaJ C-terminal domain-containing protein [Pararhizobium haloflavum]
MRNPYFVLGVQPDADMDDIKSAFRRLAMAFHPDHNQDDFGAHERFAEIQSAYQLLKDPDQRRRFDDGLIDARGRVRAARRSKDPFAGVDINRKRSEKEEPETAEAVAERIFGEAFQREKRRDPPKPEPTERETIAEAPGIDDVPIGDTADPQPAPRANGWSFLDLAIRPLARMLGGRDETVEGLPAVAELTVDLKTILRGGVEPLALPDGSTVMVTVIPGARDGHIVRMSSLGPEIRGQKSDLIVIVRHAPHSSLRAEGSDLLTSLTINLEQAIHGGSATVTTLDGPQHVDVPEWPKPGETVRLRGRGLPRGDGSRGDLVVSLVVALPENRDEKLVDFMRLQKGEWFV